VNLPKDHPRNGNRGADQMPRLNLPIARVEVREDRGRRKATCSCTGDLSHTFCAHLWIAALMQAALNRLNLEPIPIFDVYFGHSDANDCLSAEGAEA
jgi:hypothetical protein